MAGQKNSGPLTKRAAGTIAAYSLVKQDANGDVVVCTGTATDEAIGVTGEAGVLSGDLVVVYPLNSPGTILMRAAAALAINVAVFQAAAGEIDDLPASGATTHRRVGVTMEASGAADDVIEVMPEKSGFTVVAPT
ncbi:MAG: hypothetical protein OEQ18_01605 [Gammaproteobacteria bacterium]|nr:hypothetical protein [Gammaproteobacteria bacterium]